MTMRGLALTLEVAEALRQHGYLRCTPRVEEDDGLFTLTVTFHARTADEGLEILSLADELRYVCDVATVRGVVDRYGLDAAAFDDLLRRSDERAG